jgi:glycosyltransferase involved in cell wall biosynthesis
MFAPEAEAAIRSIPSAHDDTKADAVLRITAPYNCAPSKYKKTFVYGTAEFRCVTKQYILQKRPLGEVMADSDIVILTPSKWSRDGFIASGADPKRILIVPHGTDPVIYHPLEDEARRELRNQIGCRGFIFLSVGAMTKNKGLSLLLKAFAAISQKHPHVRLVMKGLDALYSSKDFLLKQAEELTPDEAHRVQERLTYIGETLNFHEMAGLYQVADAYVSPYLAEGFNMPCLEAAACGAVVICTQGGSTDDFTRPEFTLQIHSVEQEIQCAPGTFGRILRPSYEHLLYQMTTAVERHDLCAQARVAGPAFVRENFTWKHVAEKLVNILFSDPVSAGQDSS